MRKYYLLVAEGVRAQRKLVLWDVDLTLVDYSGIGAEWYAIALNNVLGVPLSYVPSFAGRTERAVVMEVLTKHGGTADEDQVQRMFSERRAIINAARDELSARGRVLPGAAEALAAFAARGITQSLVTGNLRELAIHKLAAFALDRYVDPSIGGYGALSEDRGDLVVSAIRLAGRKHGDYPPGSVVVIGDSPFDVVASLRHGAVAVGVATGRHSAAELRSSGAHAVLDDLSDTDAVLAAVLGAHRGRQ